MVTFMNLSQATMPSKSAPTSTRTFGLITIPTLVAFKQTCDTHLRLRYLAKLTRTIGLNFPSEDTKARITACAFAGATFANKCSWRDHVATTRW